MFDKHGIESLEENLHKGFKSQHEKTEPYNTQAEYQGEFEINKESQNGHGYPEQSEK